jgi:O-antigen/teichoic acid export membrane protein
MGGKHFITKASWTLVDQCVVSGGNFLLNVLLARTLSEGDYGEFALFLGAIFILRAVDYSFISYPLSVKLCVTADSERPRLLGNTAVLAGALSLVLLVLIAAGTTLLEAENILPSACLCYLCWQAQETLRRFRLADFRFREAVGGDGIAYIGQVLLVFVLLWADSITLSSALYVMSASFAAGAWVHLSNLQIGRPDFAELRDLVREYFSVGKWSLVSYELVLLRMQLFPWLLAAAAGTAATASLQAGLNIANMMNPIIFGIGNAVPQVAAQSYRSSGVLGASRAAYGYAIFGLGPIMIICAAGVLMPDQLLRTIYGASSPYLTVAIGLQLLMVAGVLDYIAEMISKTLLGVQAGRLAFLVNVVAAIGALLLALLLIESLGVLGACLGLLMSNLVRVIGATTAIAWLLARETSREKMQLATTGASAANELQGTPAE